MKVNFVFFCLIVGVLGRPQISIPPPLSVNNNNNPNIQVLSNTFDQNIPGGGYKFAFELSDGQKRDEEGTLKNSDDAENGAGILSIKGSYSFVGPDGQTYTVTYIADEKGFQPSAPFIPALAPTP